MSKIKRERYTAIFLIIISLVIYFTIPITVKGSQGLTHIGPDFFPTLIVITIGILSIILLIRTFLTKNREIQGEESKNDDNTNNEHISSLNTFLVLLTLFIYVFILVKYLNFLLATVISMFFVMWILSVRKWYYYVGFVAFVFLIDYTFRNLLNIQLP